MTILSPPHKEQPINGEIVFLAGPIQGSDDWQAKFIEKMKDYNISIANPRRTYMDGTFNYTEQVNWETCFLNQADIIIFWLTKETEVIPGRVYAQTTRFELGEHLGKSQYNNKKIIVGVHSEFSGGRYIKLRIKNDYPHVVVTDTFEELIAEVKNLL